MSENYRSKRERRQRMLGSLPVGLREQFSLRIAQAVAALTPWARLLEAIQSGLKRLPRVVEQLRLSWHPGCRLAQSIIWQISSNKGK